ncbi:hypothetical protein PIB30_001761 [Stylosanthes scabra]|uniref:WAT1-related protein n=1 Tax=Stylosanthes scabra TaxID=79078 RepID=A0ABU6V4S2_9FABA|nr:hypothetical protein [Stylosanthes scabra]
MGGEELVARCRRQLRLLHSSSSSSSLKTSCLKSPKYPHPNHHHPGLRRWHHYSSRIRRRQLSPSTVFDQMSKNNDVENPTTNLNATVTASVADAGNKGNWYNVLLQQISVYGVAAGYCLSASLLSIINKWAVMKFPYPGALTALQYFTSAAGVFIVGQLKFVEHDRLDLMTMWSRGESFPSPAMAHSEDMGFPGHNLCGECALCCDGLSVYFHGL